MSEGKETGKKRRSTLRLIAVCGIMAAFVFLGTQLRIPTSIGYMNLGDGVIMTASYILGPAAFFPAAVGSALSDLIAGYPVYTSEYAPTNMISFGDYSYYNIGDRDFSKAELIFADLDKDEKVTLADLATLRMALSHKITLD